MPFSVSGLAPQAEGGLSEMVAATVYQKHSALQNRKMTYRA